MIVLSCVCALLILLLAWTMHKAAQERKELYQRIQAPEVAVAQTMERIDGLGFVPFDDDGAYWANREELNGN